MRMLTTTVANLSGIVGLDNAKRLFDAYDVFPFYVSKMVCLNGAISKNIGLDQTIQMSRQYGGAFLQIVP